MRASKSLVLCLLSISIISSSAEAVPLKAVPLKIVNVSAPSINCVFNPQCIVVENDSSAAFFWPSHTAQDAAATLQSRTLVGKEGQTAYLYRVIATRGGSTDCVSGLVMDFGSNVRLDFNNSGRSSDVFVVTKGGLGSVGIKSAEKIGTSITFNFSHGICHSESSFFFGLMAAGKPKSVSVQATVLGSVTTSVNVAARVPKMS